MKLVTDPSSYTAPSAVNTISPDLTENRNTLDNNPDPSIDFQLLLIKDNLPCTDNNDHPSVEEDNHPATQEAGAWWLPGIEPLPLRASSANDTNVAPETTIVANTGVEPSIDTRAREIAITVFSPSENSNSSSEIVTASIPWVSTTTDTADIPTSILNTPNLAINNNMPPISAAVFPFPEVNLENKVVITPASLVTPNVHHNDFEKDISVHLTWLTGQALSQAQIRINPPELGPLDVHLHLQDAQLRAAFFSEHAEVRQRLQDAVPTLQRFLETQGIDLKKIDIGQQAPGDQSMTHTKQFDTASVDTDVESTSASSVTFLSNGMHYQPLGLLDTWA